MATRQEEDILVAQLQKGERKEEAFSKLVALYKERLYWHVSFCFTLSIYFNKN